MDGPGVFDDEVIADSEEEMDQSELKNSRQGIAEYGSFAKASSVSAFTTAGYPQNKPFSAISTFTGDTSLLVNNSSHISSIESGTSYKVTKQADTSIISAMGTFPDIEGISGTANIADRAKMRQRTQKPKMANVSEIIELTSDDDDDELSLKPSTSKVKPKTKPKPKAKAKEVLPEKAKASDVSDIAPAPISKPRPRPRPIPKERRHGQQGSSSKSTPPHGPELPIATSPLPFPLAQPIRNSSLPIGRQPIISQLPPSDPPSTIDFNERHTFGLPAIETLPDFPANGQPSSPNSLFNDATTKRRTRPLDTDAEVDELASDVPYNNHFYGDDVISPGKMPPPPTFFAGSSSSSIGGGRGGDPPPGIPGPQHDVVDLTMLPPTLLPTAQKTAPKPKKPKKKLDELYDDIVSAPVVILDEDDQDEDFDPSGDGNSKAKKKGKAKAKEKPAKTKAKSKATGGPVTTPGPGSGQVEVVITSKPPKSKSKAKEVANAKNKGKEAESSKEVNKEIFKSREFIDDSDGDDPMQLVDPRPAITTPASRPATTSKEISTPAPLAITPVISLSSRAVAPDPDSDSEMKKPDSSKNKSVAGGKKRKTIIDSDEEDNYEDDTQIAVNKAAATSKKRKVDGAEKKDKPKMKNKGKAKQIILSEDEEKELPIRSREEPAIRIEVKSSTKVRSSKKMVVDEESNPFKDDDVQDDAPPHNSTPEETAKSTKENAVPSMSKPSPAPAMVTPRPPKATPVNRDGSTPLYARYEIAPRRSSLPMSELIRRANAMPGSPFSTPHPSSASASKLKPLIARTPTSTAYSPYLKSSRSLLSKIAPLHPNRRTPPPPPPPPPPRKKSKKELELEEKWEEEMVEEVGGMEEWAALRDDERKEMRKMKWARELGGWEE